MTPRTALHNLTGAPLAPPLKWAGGKRWLIPHLRPMWQPHQHRRLVEPFAGGLAVSLSLQPARALINDINPHVIAFYEWVQRGLTIDLPLINERDTYFAYREHFNQLIRAGQHDTKAAAELFYYLNRTGYNGLCRFNRQGLFNVPFGRHNRIGYITDFAAYMPVMSVWTFTHGAFEAIPLEPDDFIYADPPYDVVFTQYTKDGFSWADQVRLVEWLAAHPGPVVASNQATDRILSLYRDHGFQIACLPARRMINSNPNGRGTVEEMLAVKGIPPAP
jgi:DNA adenine methylase